jgi:excisionase family DNA binding protein
MYLRIPRFRERVNTPPPGECLCGHLMGAESRMNAKKYLSLEDAADVLGVSKDELVRLRERGAVRGFADRGTWKFKAEDVEEYKRRKQADSDPDVPLMRDDDRSVLAADDDEVGDQPTVVRSPKSSNALSDSDVRLILDESLSGPLDSDPEVGVSASGPSDSDVSLADEPQGLVDDGSDSDVKLVSSDSVSDVSLNEGGSDSDVKLVGSDSDSDVSLSDDAGGTVDSRSDSDVKLIGSESDSDVALSGQPGGYVDAGSDSDVNVAPDSDSEIVLASDSKDDWEVRSDSDVRLVADKTGGPASDSDVNLVSATDEIALSGEADEGGSVFEDLTTADDSGIALELADSGIALEDAADSGISLAAAADSGIALEHLADSGISLSDESDEDATYTLADDSGLSLESKKSKKTARDRDELDGTVPMLDVGDEDQSDTAMEVPTLDDEDSEYQIAGADSDTGELNFDDDDSATFAKQGGRRSSETMEAEALDFDESGEFGEVEDFDEDLEVPEDILGEDEEDVDQGDVFGAGDEDFEPAFESGESQVEFMAPAGGRAAAAVEAEWGAGAFAGLALSTVLMVVCALLMFDLIRTMWAYKEPYAVNSFLLETIGGMF